MGGSSGMSLFFCTNLFLFCTGKGGSSGKGGPSSQEEEARAHADMLRGVQRRRYSVLPPGAPALCICNEPPPLCTPEHVSTKRRLALPQEDKE